MQTFYSFSIAVFRKLFPLIRLFSGKMKNFVDGRKGVFDQLKNAISPGDRLIWVHAASLGEYEQGVPVLEGLQKAYPEHKLLITFFSPSGYTVKKNNEYAHLTTYLPLDTKANAKRFVELAKPELAVFVKYEIWPNYLAELHRQQVPALLISGNFRSDHPYFKPYAGFMRTALHRFDHLFVQNEASKKTLTDNGFKKVTVSGDTRFDRVSKQLEMDNALDFINPFKGDKIAVVCGSTWPEDEALLIPYINLAPEQVKFIIAPHQIKPQHIAGLRKKLKKKAVLFSERERENLSDFQVLIIDTVGLLTKIYAHADIAFVGGAAGNTGLHNILEPATFGLPIIIGKNFGNFPEAQILLDKKGLFSVKTAEDCAHILNRLIKDETFRTATGECSRAFIEENKGASKIILNYIAELLKTPENNGE